MSVVAAKYVADNEIEIASDSFCTQYGGVKRTDSKKLFKIEVKDEHFFIGSVGDFNGKFAFSDFIAVEHEHNHYNKLENRYKAVKLMGKYRKWLSENHYPMDKWNTSFLVVCRSGLYRYMHDGELHRFHDYVAIGAGGQVATALMSEGYSPRSAVHVCCNVVANVDRPVKSEKFTSDYLL